MNAKRRNLYEMTKVLAERKVANIQQLFLSVGNKNEI